MKFSEQEARSIFTLAGIEVLNVWEVANQYWPNAYVEERKESPWFLVKTKYGLIMMGWRKRVLAIDWIDTEIRKIVTEDDVTKDETMVHAYSVESAVTYLRELAKDQPCPT